jgi:hypothetical protein
MLVPRTAPVTRLRRRLRAARRRLREARLVGLAFKSDRHPILAHVVPIRRCNLSCAYCNEFDRHSAPVPLEEMFRRIDRLAELGTTAVHLSGGEPLLHPDLDDIIQRVRQRGMLAGLLTNGYLLTRERIERLNGAGLDQLQISIDNVTPDNVSMKSLKVLDRKLCPSPGTPFSKSISTRFWGAACRAPKTRSKSPCERMSWGSPGPRGSSTTTRVMRRR